MPINKPPPSDGTPLRGWGLFLELRSEEVQEVLDNRPPWAVRWGNTVFLVVLLGVLSLSFVVKYPEVITAPFRLTSDDIPKPVVAKISGRIEQLFVKDNQIVKAGEKLAYLESSAQHDEVLTLATTLDSLAALVHRNSFGSIATFKVQDFAHLGELQGDYQAFAQQFSETATLFAEGYLAKRLNYIRFELNDLAQNHDQLLQQYDLQNRELQMAEKEFAMHKKLYDQKVIAWAEYQKESRILLAKQMPLKQLDMSLTNNLTAQTQKQKEMTELNKQANDQKSRFQQALNSLKAAIAHWKMRYVLTAPKSGRVLFGSLWQEGQMIKTDDVMFHVGNGNKGYFGEAAIRQTNAGKIKEGQRVLVKFQSYPFEQFGMVEGKIQRIAAMPQRDSTFLAIISLSNGLTTNSKKTLPFKHGLNATAEVITDNASVADRLFYQLRRLVQR